MIDQFGKVTSYIKGSLRKEINFPNGQVCCENCYYFKRKKGEHTGMVRQVCTKTFEIVVNPLSEIGVDCPLEFEDKEE